MAVQDTPAPEEPLLQKQRPLCSIRGYCGPFDDRWNSSHRSSSEPRGLAICIHCGDAVSIAAELAKWRGSLWQRVFGTEVELRRGGA